MKTYLGDETSGAQIWEDVLIGREIVGVGNGYDDETAVLVLDDGTLVTLDAGLSCCAYGKIEISGVLGGKIMSVMTEGRAENGPAQQEHYEPGPDSIYKIFIMRDGLPGTGTITVNSYEGSGYYGTGYTLYARKPEENL